MAAQRTRNFNNAQIEGKLSVLRTISSSLHKAKAEELRAISSQSLCGQQVHVFVNNRRSESH